MRQYAYAVCRNKNSVSKYFVNHCVIVEQKKDLVYHCTRNSYGSYVCESEEEFCKRYEPLWYFEFESDKNIEEYFQEQKELHKNGFNLLTNNCEQFANGFYGKKVMRQTEFYLTMAAVAAVTWAAMKRV